MKDTPQNRRRLLAYVGEIRSWLRMDNWDIVLHEDHTPEEDEAHADTWQHENHTVLNFRIAATFFDLPPEGVRNTIIHELTHAQHRDVTRQWDAVLTDCALPVRMARDSEFHVHMERFVAWVADRLEDYAPVWDPRREIPKVLPRGIYLHERPS